jgi:V-type H+-transporting ATPase subunit H
LLTGDDVPGAQGYQRAGLITPDELARVKKVDRQARAKTEALLLSEGPAYALLYLGLLRKLQRVDTMQFILVLIGDALLGACVCIVRPGCPSF